MLGQIPRQKWINHLYFVELSLPFTVKPALVSVLILTRPYLARHQVSSTSHNENFGFKISENACALPPRSRRRHLGFE
jgi:hypothetical protein